MTAALRQCSKSEKLASDLGSVISRTLSKTPDRCAFRYQGAPLTCRQLLQASQTMAAELVQTGIAPGEPIAIHVEHSFELAAGVCGVLIAGGCVVPIDPGISPERRRAILADVNPRILITQSPNEPEFENNMRCVAVNLTTDGGPDHAGIELAAAKVDPDKDLAFIVYTSGTSGGPKGVEISHANYVSRMQHIVAASSLAPDDVDLAWTPSSFIGMLDEIFYPLLTGMTAVIAQPEARLDARAFGHLIEQEAITRFRITPSLLKAFLDAGIHEQLRSIRSIYSSGEKVPADLQTKIHSVIAAELIGFYGATEAPGVAFHAFGRDAEPIDKTICKPQAFATLRVTTKNGTEAPLGEVGEIWISSPAVARGYWRKPELTAEKFVNAEGKRWYRTGDQGRRRDDEQIEIIGRVDLSEVNLHGVRISIPEIRETLAKLNGVGDAWISVIENNAQKDPLLVGHYVPKTEASVDPVVARAELATRLPTLAVPRFLLEHDRFPLTENGKLDVQRLAKDATTRLKSQTHSAVGGNQPSTGSATEIAVLNCFEQALNQRHLSVHDGFFDAGGTSLEAVTLACLISDHFKTEIGFEEIWMHPSAREMSAYIVRRGAGNSARTFFHVEGAAGPNLFAIGFGVSHLSGLWSNRRIFVNPGISGDPRVSLRKRLADYVGEYVAGVRLVQPHGPYQFLGFSFSGLLAYEVARKLHAEGEKINGVALIEPVTPMGKKPNQSYGQAAIRQIAGAIAARKLKRSSNLLRLAKNSLTGSSIRPEWRQLSAYGDVVIAAECLRPCPIPIDLIHCDACPEQTLSKWQSVTKSNLRICKVTAKDHQSLIKPESTRQWKTVIDRWPG